jgi:hypothetical protein
MDKGIILIGQGGNDPEYGRVITMVAERLNLDQVVILGRRVGTTGEEVLFSYGKTEQDKTIAQQIGMMIKNRIMRTVRNTPN